MASSARAVNISTLTDGRFVVNVYPHVDGWQLENVLREAVL